MHRIQPSWTTDPRSPASFFLPEQRLTRAKCTESDTLKALRAGWRLDETGSLSPGKWGDLIMPDRDINECSPHDTGDTRVLMARLAGHMAHAA
jgi:predicted amidohydrolase YtcJ